MEQHQAAVVRSSPAAGCCWESLAPAARVSGASQKPVTVEYIDQRASHCRVSQPDQVTSPGCTGKPNNMCWGDKSALSREEKQERRWWKVEVALNLSLQKLSKESCLLYISLPLGYIQICEVREEKSYICKKYKGCERSRLELSSSSRIRSRRKWAAPDSGSALVPSRLTAPPHQHANLPTKVTVPQNQLSPQSTGPLNQLIAQSTGPPSQLGFSSVKPSEAQFSKQRFLEIFCWDKSHRTISCIVIYAFQRLVRISSCKDENADNFGGRAAPQWLMPDNLVEWGEDWRGRGRAGEPARQKFTKFCKLDNMSTSLLR